MNPSEIQSAGTQPDDSARARFCFWWELGGLLSICGLAIFYLAVSWRKWPDPIIDFGRELYLPWRLAQGAVLYRDVDDFFGPFSQHFNGAIFLIFGPGLITLVTVNLAIFLAICAVLYLLFRRAWGTLAAQVALAIFVAVFAFGQYIGVGNANYATPYSHEATHGILACVLLTTALLHWIEKPTRWTSASIGFLLGLTAVLKLEIIFAALAVFAVAIVIQARSEARATSGMWVIMALCAMLPTAGFVGYFILQMPLRDALQGACNAWLTTATTAQLITQPLQRSMIGLDHPWQNFVEHCQATGFALGFIGLISAGGWLVGKSRSLTTQIIVGAILCWVSLWIAWTQVNWARIGRCFLGVLLIYVAVRSVQLFRPGAVTKTRQQNLARLLITVLAAALMSRMILNGRIAQYGFYQAALAGMAIPAITLQEIPDSLNLRAAGRWLMIGCMIASVAVGVIVLSHFSMGIYRTKTMEIGSGVDRFYVMPPQEDPIGLVMNTLLARLDQTPPGQTMLVLPEAVMLNYLARKPSTVRQFFFHSVTTSNGREKQIVQQLERNPPDWVVVISRDLSESGIKRYGEASGSGQELLAWVEKNYELTTSIGEDPFASGQRAGRLYSRKGGSKERR